MNISQGNLIKLCWGMQKCLQRVMDISSPYWTSKCARTIWWIVLFFSEDNDYVHFVTRILMRFYYSQCLIILHIFIFDWIQCCGLRVLVMVALFWVSSGFNKQSNSGVDVWCLCWTLWNSCLFPWSFLRSRQACVPFLHVFVHCIYVCGFHVFSLVQAESPSPTTASLNLLQF